MLYKMMLVGDLHKGTTSVDACTCVGELLTCTWVYAGEEPLVYIRTGALHFSRLLLLEGFVLYTKQNSCYHAYNLFLYRSRREVGFFRLFFLLYKWAYVIVGYLGQILHTLGTSKVNPPKF